MTCPKSWNKLRKALKNRISLGSTSQVTEDAPGIIRRWYNSLVQAERRAYESVGLGTLADMNQFIRKHTIENPRFIFDLGVMILNGGNPWNLILNRIRNDQAQSQAQPIPEMTFPNQNERGSQIPFVQNSFSPGRSSSVPRGIIPVMQAPEPKQPILTGSTSTNKPRRIISQPPRASVGRPPSRGFMDQFEEAMRNRRRELI